MQLAASQRAHPPPVPPRPSRQVVAEALKKSPRPPCPTRQAPPPPNQRPWSSTGRTIVYESAKSLEKSSSPVPEDRTTENESTSSQVNGKDDKDIPKEESNLDPRKNVTFKDVRETKCTTVLVIEETPRQEEQDNIQRQDWLEAGVRYSSTNITLPGEEVVVNGFADQEEGNNHLEFGDLDFSSIIERIAMSSLQGLPPLPRSLSGFNLNGAGLIVEPPPPPPTRSSSKSQRAPKTPSSTTSLSSQGSRPSPQGRQLTTLDTQLAILRREMFGLRQLDLSLLSQLWSLNESIQEFRQLLQEQEDRAPSPSPSSEEGDDLSYGGSNQPPPPPRRPAPTTPHLQQHHHHHHPAHHHHRPVRPSVRTSKLPPSDESPSSEEYGAV